LCLSSAPVSIYDAAAATTAGAAAAAAQEQTFFAPKMAEKVCQTSRGVKRMLLPDAFFLYKRHQFFLKTSSLAQNVATLEREN
jgi:hypothetical protein